MLMRNIRLYQLPADFEFNPIDAAQRIEAKAFRPCTALQEETLGWVSPYGSDHRQLVASAMGSGLLRMRTQFRVLPNAAVDEVLADRVTEFQERMERAPRRRELRDLREQVHASLLPQALLRSRYSWCLIEQEHGWIAIGETSDAKADAVLDLLRETLGSLPVIPLQFEHGLAELLSRIVIGGGPTVFQAGARCQLRDPAAGATEVRYRNADLADRTVHGYVQGGMRVGALEIVWRDLVSLVLSEYGVLSGIRALDASNEEPCDDPDLRLEADLSIFSGFMRQLVEDLAAACGVIAQ